MTWIIGHILAVFIGISLGLLGGGGSVLALPVLVYVMGISPKSAIAMTLVIIGLVSILGVIPHWRRGNVQLKTAGLFGSATMVGAFIGAKIAALPMVTDTFQMLLFALLMTIAAIFMIRRSFKSPAIEPENLYPAPFCQYCWLWLMSEGIIVGILTGLIGVGGGFAIVPALVLLGKVPMKAAIGTSLVIITLNSAAAFIGYIGQVELNWSLMTSFTIAASFGTIVGGYLSKYVPTQRLQQGFGYFLLGVASFVLVQNRDVFIKSTQPNSNDTSIIQGANLGRVYPVDGYVNGKPSDPHPPQC
jgi:hypothetical protein